MGSIQPINLYTPAKKSTDTDQNNNVDEGEEDDEEELNCLKPSIIQHEFLHAVGFLHEQQRSDRDDFVKIRFDNIQESKLDTFKTKITKLTMKLLPNKNLSQY